MTNISEYNRDAWDKQVAKGNAWTLPVSKEIIDNARQGIWEVVLTPQKPVPREWFPDLPGTDVLGLASGGGQQAPIFAAAGANVSVLDNSGAQLQQDRKVCDENGLRIALIQGDMRDLSCFDSGSFDMVFNPCSVCFIPELQQVFDESYRVLRPGGRLLAGFTNPFRFVFDEQKLEKGEMSVRHALPYADETHLDPAEVEQLKSDGEPFMFSHSLENIIAGQIRSGFVLKGLFEDHYSDRVSEFLPDYFATLAVK
ncbi:MAG: class I SAM-dependent methyltransferase [Planctomycetota bacterium]